MTGLVMPIWYHSVYIKVVPSKRVNRPQQNKMDKTIYGKKEVTGVVFMICCCCLITSILSDSVHIHEKREEREARFCNTVHDIVNRGGRGLIPVFALGRAQELLLILGTSFPFYLG